MGCVIIPVPPKNYTAGTEIVQGLDPARETRASLRKKLGQPDVLEVEDTWAWVWRQNFGHAFVAGTIIKPDYILKKRDARQFRVLARFDGDQVRTLDRWLEPPEGDSKLQPLPDPRQSLVWTGVDMAHWEADGTCYAVDHEGALLRRPADGDHPVRLLALPRPKRGMQAFARSPREPRLAVAGRGVVLVWDLAQGRLAAQVDGEGKGWSVPVRVRHAEFSPDGRWLAVVGLEWSLLLDTVTWEPVWRDVGRALGAGGFTGRGQRFVAMQEDQVLLVDPWQGEVVGRLDLPALGAVAWGSEGDIRGDRAWACRAIGDDLLLTDGVLLSRWSLGEVEAAWRQERHTVKPAGGGKEPALLEARLLPGLPFKARVQIPRVEFLPPPDNAMFLDNGFSLFSRDGQFLLLGRTRWAAYDPTRWHGLVVFQVFRIRDLHATGVFLPHVPGANKTFASWDVINFLKASGAPLRWIDQGLVPLGFTPDHALSGITFDENRGYQPGFHLWDLGLDRPDPAPEPGG
jgi:hypothetical protein